MVFVVEKRTTKYLPTKRLVVGATARPGCMGVWFIPRDHETFSLNFDFHENFAPRKIPAIRYIHVRILLCRSRVRATLIVADLCAAGLLVRIRLRRVDDF